MGNKIDNEDIKEIKKEYKAFKNVIFISAREKTNIDQLIKLLVKKSNSNKIDLNSTIVSNIRHFEALSKAKEELFIVKKGINEQISGDLLSFNIRKSIDYLGEITGEITNNELLGNIFSRFCIGK